MFHGSMELLRRSRTENRSFDCPRELVLSEHLTEIYPAGVNVFTPKVLLMLEVVRAKSGSKFPHHILHRIAP